MPALPLREIVRQVENELQYAPDLTAHAVDIRAVVNRQYEELCRSTSWPWLVREHPLWVFPDFDIDNAEIDLVQDSGSPASSRIFTVNAARLYDAGKMHEAADAGVYQHVHDALLGAEFGLSDMSLRNAGNGNWGEGPFAIERLNPQVPTIQFFADPRCKITDVSSATGSYRFSFPRWRLQGDVDDIIDIFDAEGRKLSAITAEQYRRNLLRTSTPQTGRLVAYARDEGADPRWSPLHAAYPLVSADDRSMLSYQREVPPVREVITAASAAGVGSFVTGRTYRIAVCWMYAGMFGPLSNVVTITASGASANRMLLSNLPKLPTTSFVSRQPESDFGWQLAIWWGEGEYGALTLFNVNAAPTDTATTIELGGTIHPYQPFKTVRYDEAVPSVYQKIRLWPRPSTQERLSVRYHARPPQLLDDSDVPLFHETFHAWLVWATCCDLSSRWAGEPFYKRCKMNAERIHQRMLGHYQPGRRRVNQKGMIGGVPMRRSTYVDGSGYDPD